MSRSVWIFCKCEYSKYNSQTVSCTVRSLPRVTVEGSSFLVEQWANIMVKSLVNEPQLKHKCLFKSQGDGVCLMYIALARACNIKGYNTRETCSIIIITNTSQPSSAALTFVSNVMPVFSLTFSTALDEASPVYLPCLSHIQLLLHLKPFVPQASALGHLQFLALGVCPLNVRLLTQVTNLVCILHFD